ncbi:MAG: hypothetical protein HY064_00920 [Bacteroidetes bacterium]|nr:hypothetical protein [Bacteroidota bacterium]
MSEEIHTRKTILQLLFRLLFEVAPTIFISYVTLGYINNYFTALETSVATQAIWLAAGLVISFVLYFYRARIAVTIILLLLANWIVAKIISKTPGEFDLFKREVQYQIFSTLFFIGWAFGLLLSRWRFAFIAIAIGLGITTISSIGQNMDMTVPDGKTFDDVLKSYIFDHLFALFAYVMFMLFISPVLVEIPDTGLKRSGRIVMRAIAFMALMFAIFIFTMNITTSNPLKAVEKILESRGGIGPHPPDNGDKKNPYDENNGLLERGDKGQKPNKDGKGGQGGNKPDDNGDGGYKMKDTMKMSDKMSQADFVMFCAKIKNYFPDGTPKPLYFVYHYLTKYDPHSESFIRDTAMPYFDEMRVDPSTLPMYRSRTDSSVIKNSLATKERKTVESEVYVSSNTWKHALLGPSGTYSVQTIPVDCTYKNMFRNAYKVRSYVSDLNNAYFVYNPSANPQLEDYQQERFNELRKVTDYFSADKKLYNYYTDMPTGVLYDSIRALAQRITKNATTPVDKVIAVRDYFLQRDENGKRIYRYSLDAGVPSDPNIPNASMLRNFLFKTHTGYCTYYAGASLFLLRSVGVPARFTTGFATIDRSDKNKGWYWFYASQAHAWTQVYFPGYGWLDFDMTIGNEDQKEAPKPDGTPPLPPPEPWLVIEGKAETDPDPKTKHLSVSFDKIIFFNDEYHLNRSFTRDVDATVCRVMYGKKDTTLAAIHAGDSIFVVSYDDAAKKVPQPITGMKIEDQVEKFPVPVIADEIHKQPKEKPKEKEEIDKKNGKANAKPITWMQIIVRMLIIVAAVTVFTFLLPLFWMWILFVRMKLSSAAKKKADRAYRLALYHYHMSGTEIANETPLEYATIKSDPVFRNGFGNFMNVYLRLKYSGGQMMNGDEQIIRNFASSILSSARKAKGFFSILISYTNISRANRFFRRPLEADQNKNKEHDGPLSADNRPQ